MHKIYKLDNGLSVVNAPVAGTQAVTFLVMVPVGSRYEHKKISGISHFVEHLMFKGTEKNPTTLDISRKLDAVGAQFNAFTSKDYTGYYIKVDGKKSGLALDILSDMLFNSTLKPEDIEREKGVIIEEIKMYDDNPLMAVDDLFERIIFGDSPLGWNIAGTKKGIEEMTREELWDYYKAAYTVKNMVLVASGNVSKDTPKLIKKYFSTKKSVATKITKNKFEKHIWKRKAVPLKDRVIVEKRDIDQAQVILGFPALKNDDPRRYVSAIMLNILGGSMSSRLFTEVREKRGLAYMVRSSAVTFRDVGAITIHTGLDPKRLKDAFNVIFAECKKMTNELVSNKELINAKNNLAGHLALSMEDSSSQANWYAGKFWFGKKVLSPKEEISNMRKVTVEDVQKLAKDIFKMKEMRIAVIGPLDKSKILKILQ